VTEHHDLAQINVEAGVSLFTHKPFCRIEIKDDKGAVNVVGQLDPDAVRALAMQWIEAACAAEHDALLMNFMLDTVGMEDETVGHMLLEMRRLRGEGGE
jgi:hypothetical protein